MSKASRRAKQQARSVNVADVLDNLLYIYATKGAEAFGKACDANASVVVDDDVMVRFREACEMIRKGIGLIPDPEASTERTRGEQIALYRLGGEFMSLRLSVLGVYIKIGKEIIVECLDKMLNQQVSIETQSAEALIGRILEGSLEVFCEAEDSPIRKRYFEMLDGLQASYSRA